MHTACFVWENSERNSLFVSIGAQLAQSKFSPGITKDLERALVIQEDRLYFTATTHRPKNNEFFHFICTDNVLRYEPFFVDFGPLNLGCLYKFTVMLKHKLRVCVCVYIYI